MQIIASGKAPGIKKKEDIAHLPTFSVTRVTSGLKCDSNSPALEKPDIPRPERDVCPKYSDWSLDVFETPFKLQGVRIFNEFF